MMYWWYGQYLQQYPAENVQFDNQQFEVTILYGTHADVNYSLKHDSLHADRVKLIISVYYCSCSSELLFCWTTNLWLTLLP